MSGPYYNRVKRRTTVTVYGFGARDYPAVVVETPKMSPARSLTITEQGYEYLRRNRS